MSGKRINRDNLSKSLVSNVSFEDDSHKSINTTIYNLRWVFLVTFLFIVSGIFLLFIIGKESYIQVILSYSMAGFLTFFMSYFGWLLAREIIEIITGKKEQMSSGILYYFRQNKKN